MNGALPSPVSETVPQGEQRVLRDYLQLSKSRIVSMMLLTTACGYAMGGGGSVAKFIAVLGGTALVASGANALNQCIEREFDRTMERTCRRPLPAGRISGRSALVFGVGTSMIGLFVLFHWVSPLAALLGLGALTAYIGIYTPMKRRTPMCTFIGALPGATPPLIGWAASAMNLQAVGGLLFALLFLWQIPHFMAIGWIHRFDYRKAGFAMLSGRDSTGIMSAGLAVTFAIALIMVSLAPVLSGFASLAYLLCAMSAGTMLLWTCARFLMRRSIENARMLFAASNGYLIILMMALMMFVRD